MKGNCGEILLPALITIWGMLQDSNAVFVSKHVLNLPVNQKLDVTDIEKITHALKI